MSLSFPRSIKLAPTRFAAGIFLITLAGLLARGAILLPVIRANAIDDPDGYLPLAESILRGGGYSIHGRPSAYRPPLYPLLLVPVAASSRRVMEGVGVLHLILGAGTIVTTAATARRWGLSDRRAWVAAAIVALDPVLLAQSRSVMTETLAAFLTAFSLWGLTLPRIFCPIVAGVLLGLASLCRPSALAVAVLTAVGGGFDGSIPWKSRCARAVIIIACTFVVLLPWALRNRLAMGETIWTTTHGGYTLALANNPTYYDEVVNGPPGAVWNGRRQWLWWNEVHVATRGMSESDADRWYRREALRTIRARPADFLRASLARLGRFWGVAPATAVYCGRLRLATACWTIPLWIALFSGLLRARNWSWPRFAAICAISAMTLVHTFYWTDMRMRAATLPAVALIAASGRASKQPPEGR